MPMKLLRISPRNLSFSVDLNYRQIKNSKQETKQIRYGAVHSFVAEVTGVSLFGGEVPPSVLTSLDIASPLIIGLVV